MTSTNSEMPRYYALQLVSQNCSIRLRFNGSKVRMAAWRWAFLVFRRKAEDRFLFLRLYPPGDRCVISWPWFLENVSQDAQYLSSSEAWPYFPCLFAFPFSFIFLDSITVQTNKTWCLTSTWTTRLSRDGEKGGGGWGRLYTYRYTVTTRMTPALRWAATRAILMFINCEQQSHKTVHKPQPFWRERRAEAESSRSRPFCKPA